MILRIVEAKVCGDSCIRVAFNDGTNKVVDLSGLLDGAGLSSPCATAGFLAWMELDHGLWHRCLAQR